jgi:hypothetical protein
MPLFPQPVRPGRRHSAETAPRPYYSAIGSESRKSSTHSFRIVGARPGYWISLVEEKNMRNVSLDNDMPAADLIVESCHPVRRTGPVGDVVLALKTAHLVF